MNKGLPIKLSKKPGSGDSGGDFTGFLRGATPEAGADTALAAAEEAVNFSADAAALAAEAAPTEALAPSAICEAARTAAEAATALLAMPDGATTTGTPVPDCTLPAC